MCLRQSGPLPCPASHPAPVLSGPQGKRLLPFLWGWPSTNPLILQGFLDGVVQGLQDAQVSLWVPSGCTLPAQAVQGDGPCSWERGCRAGNYEDLMASPCVVATCNSFWSGERSPCYL